MFGAVAEVTLPSETLGEGSSVSKEFKNWKETYTEQFPFS